MKKTFLTLLAAVLATPAIAAPGNTATAQGVATAEIVAPITLQHVNGAAINFGGLVANSGGTVTISSPGIVTSSGSVALVPSNNRSLDAFTVTFQRGRTFNFSTTGGTVSNGGNSMSFTTAPTCTVCNFGANATSGTVSVGGTLTVGANQPVGIYTGTYQATASYN